MSLLTPNTFTFDGTISVSANNSSYAETISVVPTSNGGCRLFNGYEDIATGGQVTVYAADGKLLRSGALLGSRYDSSTRSCAYRFRVDNVPEQDMYQVEVTHRGKVAVSLAEAKAGTAALTLGG